MAQLRQDPWWKGAVVYQVYPRSFADSNGDGVGDLAGITAHLPYVAALGVDAIWLSPVFPSPMVDNGYDVSDYAGIDPVFGDLAAFDALLAQAHKLGLKLILDQVWSHSSDAHPWFEQSRKSREGPYADWYVWADPAPGGGPPNNWQCWFGQAAWSWEPARGQYYLHNFHPRMPDLNWWSPAVAEAMLEAGKFWLDRGVDGLRLDVCNYYLHDRSLRDNPPKAVDHPAKPHDLQAHLKNCDRPENLAHVEAIRAILDAYGDRMAVAEICSDNNLERALEYTQGPRRLHTAYSFSYLRDWPGTEGFKAIVRAYDDALGAWPSFAFSNHDVPRVATRWGGGDPVAARMFLALLLTLRGTIFLYQGEELSLPESDVPYERLTDPSGLAGWPLYKGRDGCRTPFPWDADAPQAGFSTAEPWLPADPAHASLAAARQADDPASSLSLARALIAWRRGEPAVRAGTLAFLDAPAPVIAFVRDGEGRRITAVFNVGPEARTCAPPPGEALFAEGARVEGGGLQLDPWGFAILGG